MGIGYDYILLLSGPTLTILSTLAIFINSLGIKVITLIVAIIAMVSFVLYARTYHNLYSLLLVLSENNKLHPLRELIMIFRKNTKRGLENYRFRITRAVFEYKIENLNPIEQGDYDVQYKVQLYIALPKKKKIPLIVLSIIKKEYFGIQFYTICENSTPSSEKVTIEQEKEQAIRFEKATFSGESRDRSEEFAGLYQTPRIRLPQDMMLEHEELKVTVEYNVCRQIVDGAQQYTFVIIPQNYGRKISRIEIKVDGELKEPPVLQQFSPTRPYYKYINTFNNKSDNIYGYGFSPNMNCAYVVQIELPTETSENE